MAESVETPAPVRTVMLEAPSRKKEASSLEAIGRGIRGTASEVVESDFATDLGDIRSFIGVVFVVAAMWKVRIGRCVNGNIIGLTKE